MNQEASVMGDERKREMGIGVELTGVCVWRVGR